MKNLVIPEEYESGGQKKTRWNKVGVLFEANGKQYVKLFLHPGTLIHAFESDKEDQPTKF